MPETLTIKNPNEWYQQDWVNRQYITEEKDFPQAKTFKAGLDFLDTNASADNWFLTIETFDPHEPYFSPEKYKQLYPHEYDGPLFDWPPYRRVQETPEQVRHLRFESAALHSMCDAYLGKILDKMDELDLWRDTLLIVNTDHGFLLGEHEWWGKCCQPFYNEVANTPLFIWDPRCGKQGERRSALVQTIDLAPTLYDYFGIEIPDDVEGKPLAETIENDSPVREFGLFGIFGGHVNCTDGRYVYMRAPSNADNKPLFEYTLMPAHMRFPFLMEELQDIQLAEPFSFTKGCRTMKIEGYVWGLWTQTETMLFDLKTDPNQENPIQDEEVERRMIVGMIELMKRNDAPKEQYQRLGLEDYL